MDNDEINQNTKRVLNDIMKNSKDLKNIRVKKEMAEISKIKVIKKNDSSVLTVMKNNRVAIESLILKKEVDLIVNRTNTELNKRESPYYFEVESSENGLFNIIKLKVKSQYLSDAKYRNIQEKLNEIVTSADVKHLMDMQNKNGYGDFLEYIENENQQRKETNKYLFTFAFNEHIYKNKEMLNVVQKQLDFLTKLNNIKEYALYQSFIPQYGKVIEDKLNLIMRERKELILSSYTSRTKNNDSPKKTYFGNDISELNINDLMLNKIAEELSHPLIVNNCMESVLDGPYEIVSRISSLHEGDVGFNEIMTLSSKILSASKHEHRGNIIPLKAKVHFQESLERMISLNKLTYEEALEMQIDINENINKKNLNNNVHYPLIDLVEEIINKSYEVTDSNKNSKIKSIVENMVSKVLKKDTRRPGI